MAPKTSLFQVFLRLRPPMQAQVTQQISEPWLLVETPAEQSTDSDEINAKSKPTHVTLQPPNDSRKRAIERFGFTKIFEEQASQLDVFEETGTADIVAKLLHTGRDGLIATLGVTGSGKSHTILGSKTQRGLTQMTLDVLFRSIGSNIRRTHYADLPSHTNLLSDLQACDSSEAQILSATTFLEMVYGDGDRARISRAQTPMLGPGSRAQTPMTVCISSPDLPGSFPVSPPHTPSWSPFVRESEDITPYPFPSIEKSLQEFPEPMSAKEPWRHPSKVPFWHRHSPKKICAKPKIVKDSFTNHHVRKPAVPRPSTFAQSPDVSQLTVEVEPNSAFVVLVSMYEVYNDRIFDLLSNGTPPGVQPMSTRQGAALQKGLMRRPLLFKNTEMSPERKVVAGLRKIVCNSYDEAIMVLETGLTERRVAGTGSNSVSSRSHGFFCIEIKKTNTSGSRFAQGPECWTGGTLSIVDLAGSERARNAKTTGSTLAEAGKINESLMYLGQCLQVQSDCQQDGSKPIVPFRQCKLTELLFSNSFPSSSQPSTYRAPQKAVMVVTADPVGDFNATSQILRYSALAREVTVPRIPSVTSTIVAAHNVVKFGFQSGRLTPNDGTQNSFTARELEQAHHEVTRLTEECDALAVKLAEEEIKRSEAELKLQLAEERVITTEQNIREECWQEMEVMMEQEKIRWRLAWEEQRLSSQEHIDGKIDIMQKAASFTIHEDTYDGGKMEELERENGVLRARLQASEQDVQTRSPTKKSKAAPKTPSKKLVLEEGANTNIATNPFLASLRKKASNTTSLPSDNEEEMNVFDISPRKLSLRNSNVTRSSLFDDGTATPGTGKKKQRKLTTRKWDLGDPDEI